MKKTDEIEMLQVKEERPSPVSECGLCMHPPRTPHTSECVFPYGLTPSSPVALMTGPPRPLRATTPPQRPVPHIPPPPPNQQPPTGPPLSSYQRSIKQEKLDGEAHNSPSKDNAIPAQVHTSSHRGSINVIVFISVT